MDEIRLRVEAVVNKVFEAKGMDLIELKVRGRPNDVIIEITADKPKGGITIEECAIMNKLLVSAIEQESFLAPQSFSLELSSPGLDRPLTTLKDFRRMIDQELRFWLKEPMGGKKEVQGLLLEATESGLKIDTGKMELVLPLIAVLKGQLVI